MNVILQYLPEILTFLATGGIIGLFTLKQERKAKDLDNVGRDIANAKSLLEEQKELTEHYKTRYLEAVAKVDELSAKAQKDMASLRSEMDEMKGEMAVLRTQLENARMLCNAAEAMKCNVLTCPKRSPKLNKELLKEVAGFKDEDFDEKPKKARTRKKKQCETMMDDIIAEGGMEVME